MTQNYFNDSPNFSLVLPGDCNAKCAFCFWRKSASADPGVYAELLNEYLLRLPGNFRTVSITGGEPTMSSALPGVLRAIEMHRARLDRVVLTTNGYRLAAVADKLAGIVDFVNISRHHADSGTNRLEFHTSSVPASLRTVIAKLNQLGIPVTLSKVLGDENRATIERYIKFARSQGASQVFLRKPHGSLEPHPVEAEFSRFRAQESSCPVCLDRRMVIGGMPVSWKRGLLEPIEVGFHELIMQQDGALSYDWAGRYRTNTREVVSMFARRDLTRVEQHRAASAPVSWASGCSGRAPVSHGCGGGCSSGGGCRSYSGGC